MKCIAIYTYLCNFTQASRTCKPVSFCQCLFNKYMCGDVFASLNWYTNNNAKLDEVSFVATVFKIALEHNYVNTHYRCRIIKCQMQKALITL